MLKLALMPDLKPPQLESLFRVHARRVEGGVRVVHKNGKMIFIANLFLSPSLCLIKC